MKAADYIPPEREARRLAVPAAQAGQRFDRALAELFPEFSRSRLKAWIESGQALLDGRAAAPATRVYGGESISLRADPDPAETGDRPEDLPLTLVHEDAALLVVDKPAGLVVHPGSGNPTGTLLNALLHHAPELAELPRAGIVHRLDKDTSGLLVVARTLQAHTALVRALKARTVRREYLALVAGDVKGPGEVDAPVGRHPVQRTRMAVVAGGRPARTRYRVVERLAGTTLVECALDTGRTHQIRVHMQSIGHPLVGDPVYGPRAAALPAAARAFPRQALHAARLGLDHPDSGAPMLWNSPLPADMEALLAGLRA